MIRVALLFALVGILSACSQRETVEAEAFGLLERYQVDRKTGQKDGDFRKFELDGTLIEHARYRNGNLHGERVIYYPSGSPEIAEQYVNGVLDGTFRSYYDGDLLEMEGPYVDGVMVGEWRRYYQNGQLMEVVTFADNEENGPFIEYHENGNLKAEGQYYQGDNEHGLLTLYDENGELARRMECDSGICHTIWLRPDLQTQSNE
ncbi:MAG: toxin-antitoxin system YwqK family antitoxin [Saprospiraceae bacterium]|nr:toxin-antitoxin system YwqK family antitoxin [Saprospiraceae bacterium]